MLLPASFPKLLRYFVDTRQIGHLLGLFMNWAHLHEKQDQAELDKYVKESFGGEAEMEARYQELLRLLEEQIAAVEAAFAEQMKAQEEKDAIARDSCLAPEDGCANMVLRLEMALDRAIDRKVRILLTMRKEGAQQCKGGSPTAQQEASPPDNESNDREAEELSKLVGLEGAEATPNFSSPGAGLKASATQTESPAEQNAGETSKSPEQSQNVIENKGPADCPDQISKD